MRPGTTLGGKASRELDDAERVSAELGDLVWSGSREPRKKG